jgi:NADH dehydrogenase
MKVVLVAGGSGFVGRAVVGELTKAGYRVIVHDRTHRTIPTYADAIVNLVGIIREDGQTYREAHVDTTAWLVRLGKKLKVKTFVQMSALGVEAETTQYQKTKLQAEAIVKASGLRYAILRPSMIFGAEDRSVNRFRGICRTGFFPLLGNGLVQPVHVGVIAKLTLAALEGRFRDRVVEVGGPEVMRYHDLADRIHPGVRVVRMPGFFARFLTFLGEYLSFFPTREQVVMLGQDTIVKDRASVKLLEKLAIKSPRLS